MFCGLLELGGGILGVPIVGMAVVVVSVKRVLFDVVVAKWDAIEFEADDVEQRELRQIEFSCLGAWLCG